MDKPHPTDLFTHNYRVFCKFKWVIYLKLMHRQ